MTECPTQQFWQAVLDQRLPAAQEQAMSVHAEECSACQNVLETLTQAPALSLVRQTRDTHDSRTLRKTPPISRTASSVVQPFTTLGLSLPDIGSLPVLPGYELLEELGRGGMGVVFKARHLELNRVVALKMLREGVLADPDMRARFRDEARVVARLQHPGIVQIHEVGTLEGRPYLALEYVAGSSLDRVLQNAALAPRDAATLLIPLAEALEAAHQQGVLHRDLKPANVLLSFSRAPEARAESTEARASGARLNGCVPKITDFGLAKPLDDDSGRTVTGMIVGTPSYMAPEQAAGERKFAPTVDVYALGAILYECVTGRPPFKGATAHDTVHQVLTNEPVPPRRLQPTVPRDLETICLKSLHKEPAKRYATAQAFADDLRCFLDGRPIKARPATPLERMTKWCRRYPAVAALLVVATVATVVATALAVWALTAAETARQATFDAEQQTAKAERAAAAEKSAREEAQKDRDAKETQRRYAQAIADFVKDDFLALTSIEGQDRFGGEGKDLLSKDTTLRQLLDRAAAKLRQRRDLDPRTEADLCWIIGVNYRGVGAYDQAVVFLERCLSLRRQVLGPEDDETLNAGNSLTAAYTMAGNWREAIALGEQVRNARVKTVGLHHPKTLAILLNLAESHRIAGRWREAISLYEQIRDIHVRQQGAEGPDTLRTYSRLAATYQDAGRLGEAITLFQRVRKAQVRILGAEHPDTLHTLYHLAEAFRNAGQLPEAVALFEQVYEVTSRTLGPDHPETLVYGNGLGLAYFSAGQLSEAITLLEQVRDIQAEKLGEEHLQTLSTLHNLALAYHQVGRLPEAMSLLEKVRDAEVQQLGTDHPTTLNTLGNLARVYQAVDRLPEAITLLEQVRDAKARTHGADHPHTLNAINSLAVAYRGAGKLTEAAPLFEQAARGIEKHQFLPASAKQIILNTVQTYEDLEQYALAEQWLRKWLAVVKQRSGAESNDPALVLTRLGSHLVYQKKWTDAESVLRQALAHHAKTHPNVWITYLTQSFLGAALMGQKKDGEAEPLLLAGYTGMKPLWDAKRSALAAPLETGGNMEIRRLEIRTVGHQRRLLTDTLTLLVELFEARGQHAEAARWRQEREQLPPALAEPTKK